MTLAPSSSSRSRRSGPTPAPPVPVALPATAGTDGVYWQAAGRGKYRCAWTWEYAGGVLASAPALAGDCPAAAEAGRACWPAPWQPARVFRLAAAVPGGGDLCAAELARRRDDDARRRRRDALRCQLCERPAGPAPSWPMGCRPRETPAGLEAWAAYAWTERGQLRIGQVCPACAALRDRAAREGRSIVVTRTDPPAVALGDVVPRPSPASD